MISMLMPLSAGNAVQIYLTLRDGATYQRVLRRTEDAFTGPGDTGAVVVVDECAVDAVIDTSDLVNGTTFYYRAYDWTGVWVDQATSFPAVPATTYIDDLLDPQEVVRDRVQLGINAAIVRGELNPPSGAIQVTTAPFVLLEGTTFPTVSVHLDSTGPEHRGIGDQLEDFLDPLTPWISTEGWLAQIALAVVAVSQNPDERIQLRKVLRRIIQANFPVFAASSMSQIEFRQTDSEQPTENNVPLYFTNGAFACVAPAWIRDPGTTISDVIIKADIGPLPDSDIYVVDVDIG